MFRHQSQRTITGTTKIPHKLIAGFAAFAATAIIASSGFAAAQTLDKPTKAMCQQAGFTNYGQCVKEWAHHKNHPGNGYGGGNNVSVSNAINVTLNHSNNNVINVATQIIINIFN